MKFIAYISFLFLVCYSATHAKTEANRNNEKSKCGTFAVAGLEDEIIAKLCHGKDNNGRCVLQAQIISPSGHFMIHYDTTGLNAVPIGDEDKNGIPDYVDSAAYYLDYAFLVEVDSMGFVPPASDNSRGGSDAVDVYLVNLGDGNVFDYNYYGATVKDKIINSSPPYPTYTSFMYIDNDFSPRDSVIIKSDSSKYPTFVETGVAALKITTAHEFNHVLQMKYGVSNSFAAIYEMTSTWLESRLYPDTRDYFLQIKVLFNDFSRYRFGDISNDDVGYKYAIFFRYLHAKYGDTPILRTWELFGKGIHAYVALDSALAEKGTSLEGEWCEFLPWVYHTASRAVEGSYFNDAKDFPEFNFFATILDTGIVYTETSYLKPFELRPYRFLLESKLESAIDTVDFMITNTDFNAMINLMSYDVDYSVVIANYAENNYNPIENTGYYYRIVQPEGYICSNMFFNKGHLIDYIDFAYPNPFVLSKNQSLMFPVPEGVGVSSLVTLNIYNTEYLKVFSATKNVTTNHDHFVFSLSSPLPEALSSGVYFYETNYKGARKFGKFAIVK